MERKILIIGSGGREHALGEKLARPNRRLFFAPGNGGTSQIGTNIDVPAHDVPELVGFASDHHINLTFVGPEQPLADGVVDAFREKNLSIFGPTQQAAQLETSKIWSARFMNDYDIPHPASHAFFDVNSALDFIDHAPWPMVIKASGLAAGKGVMLPETREEAIATVNAMMQEHKFGDAGREIVIQERLEGPEVSVFALCDGVTAVPLIAVRDHKRLLDGDRGPNTGGMGSCTYPSLVPPELMEQIQREILQKTVDGMRIEGTPYHGVLFAGLMLTDDGPKVLEYNARFGDPETQSMMMLLESDLYPLLWKSVRGGLKDTPISFRRGAAVCIVLAAPGYPDAPQKGTPIYGADRPHPADVQFFHAGTIMENGTPVTHGGRVMGITARAGTLQQALEKAYGYIGKPGVYFDGMQYRRDIGYQSMQDAISKR